MALKRLRMIQRRKALGFTQEALAEQVGCERTTVIRWERAETEPQPWVRPRLIEVLQLTAGELNEMLADVADVPGGREGFTLVTSVPLDFSLSTAYTVRIMEGFSAHDIASRREGPSRPGDHHRGRAAAPGTPVGRLAFAADRQPARGRHRRGERA